MGNNDNGSGYEVKTSIGGVEVKASGEEAETVQEIHDDSLEEALERAVDIGLFSYSGSHSARVSAGEMEVEMTENTPEQAKQEVINLYRTLMEDVSELDESERDRIGLHDRL